MKISRFFTVSSKTLAVAGATFLSAGLAFGQNMPIGGYSIITIQETPVAPGNPTVTDPVPELPAPGEPVPTEPAPELPTPETTATSEATAPTETTATPEAAAPTETTATPEATAPTETTATPEATAPTETTATPEATAPTENAETASEESAKPRVYTFNASTLSCVMQCPECGVFSRAIHEAGLEDLVGGARRITIFAPTDEAFARWPQEKINQLFQCKPALAALVLNHIAPESLSPAELKKINAIANCCNYNVCLEMCGKSRAEILALHCEAIADQEQKTTLCCQPKDDSIGVGGGRVCKVGAFPFPAIRCNNGYVYPIDRVQIPRGLKVYQALKAQEAQADDATIEFELIEIAVSEDAAKAAVENAADATEKAVENATDKAETATEAAADATQKAEDATDAAEKAAEKADDAEDAAEEAAEKAEVATDAAQDATEKAGDATDAAQAAAEKVAENANDKPAETKDDSEKKADDKANGETESEKPAE